MAASLALQANVIDEEAVRILLALNDSNFVCKLFVDVAVQDRTVTPEAWHLMCRITPESILSTTMFNTFMVALRERNDRGAQRLAYFLTKLQSQKEKVDRIITEALAHGSLYVAAWIMTRPSVEVNRPVLHPWLIANSSRIKDLVDELEKQIERSKISNGKRNYLENLAGFLRNIVKDNAELQSTLKQGTPDEVSDALCNCLLVTDGSKKALEQYACDRPECIPQLAELIQKYAKGIEDNGTTKAVGNFFRYLAHALIQHANASMTAARVGG